jgi:hypothetical protein
MSLLLLCLSGTEKDFAPFARPRDPRRRQRCRDPPLLRACGRFLRIRHREKADGPPRLSHRPPWTGPDGNAAARPPEWQRDSPSLPQPGENGAARPSRMTVPSGEGLAPRDLIIPRCFSWFQLPRLPAYRLGPWSRSNRVVLVALPQDTCGAAAASSQAALFIVTTVSALLRPSVPPECRDGSECSSRARVSLVNELERRLLHKEGPPHAAVLR